MVYHSVHFSKAWLFLSHEGVGVGVGVGVDVGVEVNGWVGVCVRAHVSRLLDRVSPCGIAKIFLSITHSSNGRKKLESQMDWPGLTRLPRAVGSTPVDG